MDSVQAGDILSGCGALAYGCLHIIGSILGIMLLIFVIIVLKFMDLLSGDPL